MDDQKKHIEMLEMLADKKGYQRGKQETEEKLLYDLDEIDNKPWRVFRQLANIMPEYAEEYKRYERFYAHGGGKKVDALIEEFERSEDEAKS